MIILITQVFFIVFSYIKYLFSYFHIKYLLYSRNMICEI